MPTPLLNLPLINAASQQGYVVANTDFRILEVAAAGVVQSITLATPPGSPTDGHMWFVAAAPTGAWSAWAGHLVCRVDGFWHSMGQPQTGRVLSNVATSTTIRWNGSAWV